MKYDVIVVGAGSAGCVMADRLTENSARSVLLLEAGRDYLDLDGLPAAVRDGNDESPTHQDSHYIWSFVGKPTGERERSMHVPRGKLIGGSGSVNGQVFLRGIPEDFDSWVSLGNDDWRYLDVLPYFRKIERDLDIRDDFHGSDGPIPIRRTDKGLLAPVQRAFLQACLAAGFPEVEDMNSPQCTGVGLNPMNQDDGVRMSTFITHLAPARHRLNLTVRGDVLTRRVLFDGKRAVGVEMESGGERFVAEAEEIVLSAGAIGSPHLLMLSGIGPADALYRAGVKVIHDLPGVGKNMRDHPMVEVTARVKSDFALQPDTPRAPVVLRYTAPGSTTRNDMRIMPLCFRETKVGSDTYIGVVMIELELAAGAGEIRLVSGDVRVQPELDYHFLEDRRDLQRLREGVRLGVSLLEHPAYANILDERVSPENKYLKSDVALEAWILDNVGTGHHVVGTCKMGSSSDPAAVVDQLGRIRGLDRIRVADASVMPDVVRANTNATTIMIGERVAEFMK